MSLPDPDFPSVDPGLLLRLLFDSESKTNLNAILSKCKTRMSCCGLSVAGHGLPWMGLRHRKRNSQNGRDTKSYLKEQVRISLDHGQLFSADCAKQSVDIRDPKDLGVLSTSRLASEV